MVEVADHTVPAKIVRTLGKTTNKVSNSRIRSSDSSSLKIRKGSVDTTMMNIPMKIKSKTKISKNISKMTMT